MSGDISTKRCTVCKTEKPRSDYRKYSGRSSDGLRPLCKDCQRAYEMTWRETRAERLAEARTKRAEKEKIYRSEYDAKNRGWMLCKGAARRSAKKGIPCDLMDHIVDIEARVQAGVCEMTGLPFNFHSAGTSWDSPSIDRVDPKGGYLYSNIRVICFGMNTALGNWGEEATKTIAKAWLSRC